MSLSEQERQEILRRAEERRASQQSTVSNPAPEAQPAAAAGPRPAGPPRVVGSHGAEVRIVDRDSPRTEPRLSRGGVVQHPVAAPAAGQKTYGARVVNPEDRHQGPRVRGATQPGVYGGRVVNQPAAQPMAPPMGTPMGPRLPPPSAPQPAAAPAPDLNAQISAMGAGMAAANPGPGVPLVTPTVPMAGVAPGNLSGIVTAIMTQHMRPETLEQQHRALRASGLDENGLICWVNPVLGTRLNDALLGRIPHVRASSDMGPWMRWTLTSRIPTKYTLVIDDDCIPGPRWLSLAIERLERAEAQGDRIIVAAAGLIFQSDSYDDVIFMGPESRQREEVTVDLGRGAWLMHTHYARHIALFPTLGTGLATPIHIATALQKYTEGGAPAPVGTIVLPYPHATREVWGMLDQPKVAGSMSSYFDREAAQGRGPTAAQIRQDDYAVYRDWWEPLFAIQAAASTVADGPVEAVDAQA